ncbi:hypothetical protein FMEXI_1645 [Fusarium mexicanum]|uniref:Uncharacterized protein n=1 Tax=Fusarium mexicanum TaxID=751941 RepID=A0A8H5JJF8_9HYPO|nr:hypothetical protein FMEXI_1645 [Fusarium mexicanum]
MYYSLQCQFCEKKERREHLPYIGTRPYTRYTVATHGAMNCARGSFLLDHETIMAHQFERRKKGNFDIRSEEPQRIEIPIPGFREDHISGYYHGHLSVQNLEYYSDLDSIDCKRRMIAQRFIFSSASAHRTMFLK